MTRRREPQETDRRRYPSDLSERDWNRVERLVRSRSPKESRRSADLREVVNGIHYRWTTGCAWRMLPHDFPPWPTIYGYFRRWNRQGALPALRTALLCRAPRPKARSAEATP